MPVARAARGIVAGRQHMRAEARSRETRNSRCATAASVHQNSEGTPNSAPEPNRPLNTIVLDRHGFQRRQPAADAGEHAHRRQRHQERRQPRIGDERAVERADRRAGAEPRQRRRAATASRADAIGGEQRGDGDDRADREVDLARRQHEDHADRHDGDRRRLLHDVEQVATASRSRRRAARRRRRRRSRRKPP